MSTYEYFIRLLITHLLHQMKPNYCGLYKNAVPLPLHLHNSCTLRPIASLVYFIFSTTELQKMVNMVICILYEISIYSWVTATSLELKLYNLIVAFFLSSFEFFYYSVNLLRFVSF